MTEQEVKDTIGEEHWSEFCKWMGGQTVGMNLDGSINYYECDVDAFKQKLKSGYDRQQDPGAWD